MAEPERTSSRLIEEAGGLLDEIRDLAIAETREELALALGRELDDRDTLATAWVGDEDFEPSAEWLAGARFVIGMMAEVEL